MLRSLTTARRKWWIAIALASVAGAGGFALAQTVEGLDIQQVLSRGRDAEADAKALAHIVARSGDRLQAQVKETVDAGQRNLLVNGSQLGGGPGGAIDFDEIIQTATANTDMRGQAPQLIVFASLSMPEESLKRLIQDTSNAGGMVVFNGFPGNSMKAFQQGIMKVVDRDAHYANIGVDPRLFRAFNVTVVPTVAVTTSDFDLCDGFNCQTQLPPFDRMSGNVPLEYALETFAEGNGPSAPVAEQALFRLRNGGRQ